MWGFLWLCSASRFPQQNAFSYQMFGIVSFLPDLYFPWKYHQTFCPSPRAIFSKFLLSVICTNFPCQLLLILSESPCPWGFFRIISLTWAISHYFLPYIVWASLLIRFQVGYRQFQATLSCKCIRWDFCTCSAWILTLPTESQYPPLP